MSYVRWSRESSVYVFDTETPRGEIVIECCGCDIDHGCLCVKCSEPSAGFARCCFQAGDAEQMGGHLREHQRRGDSVPEFVFERLAHGRNFN